ncbi:MAG: AAA family ATPase [Chitinispirillaceae bacterium]|nr:AAA family ATPase [Chitinispirillaceae bacterium]
MIIRFVAKNIYSFKDETEFNLFPNKTQRLQHHRVSVGDFEFLRYSAIYGANGSGKSNLVKSISLLQRMVEDGKIKKEVNDLKFKLTSENEKLPVSLAIEFVADGKVYYFTITFDQGEILHEYLSESSRNEDALVYERTLENGLQKISFYSEYYSDEKKKLFAEVLTEKLLPKNELLLTFLNKKFPGDFRSIKTVFNWFSVTLFIIRPETKPGGIADILDKNIETENFGNKFISSLNTGITKIEVEKKKFEDFFDANDKIDVNELIGDLKNEPDHFSVFTNSETGEEITVVNENNELVAKRLVTTHLNSDNKKIKFYTGQESDGTRRLIEYIPAIQAIVNNDLVFLIDEVERSIHPLLIKEILGKILLDTNARGQLIFTTHESNLLDQNILRPDEIWLTQKDCDGSTKMYSLSDYKIHNTIDIENGYLNGRYGGIPFLGNLKDLSW